MDEPVADEVTALDAAIHDARNHLAIVLGFVQLSLDAHEAGRMPDREHLEGIMRSATAAADLLRARVDRAPAPGEPGSGASEPS